MKFLNKPGKKLKKIGVLQNKQEPTISIITPFYNGGATLEETANTIFSQTYPYFEWIIIDDGSKSKSCLEKLEEISKSDPRVKVFHKENGGPSQARDFGITKASKSSKYIYFLDCDDLIENTMLETMYWTLETHKNASFVYPSMINFGAHEYYWEPYFTLEEEIINNVMCISTMIKKDDLLEVGCFGIKEKAMYEDWNLWLKLLGKGKIPIRLNAPLFWYRTSNTGELSRAKTNHDKAMSLIKKTAKNIKEEVEVIQFPRISDEGPTTNLLSTMVLPQYKKEQATTVLFLLDNLNLNSNSLSTIEIIKRLHKENYNCILVTTEPSKNNLRQDIKEYVSELHDMSNFLETKDYPLFVNYLINSRNVDKIVINNCSYAYAMLPEIKYNHKNLNIIEYIEDKPVKIRNQKLGNLIGATLTPNQSLKNEITNASIISINDKNNSINNYDINKKQVKEMLGLSKDKIIVSYIDNVLDTKRPELFVEIAKKLSAKYKNIEFVLNGNGSIVKKILEKIKKLKLQDKVIYIPEQEDCDIVYKASDIIVNCSLKEGVSSTNYKALLYGLPIVSTTADEQEKIVGDKTGILIPENISKEKEIYAHAIIKIIENLENYKRDAQVSQNYITLKYDTVVEKLKEKFKEKTKQQDNIAFYDLIYTQYTNILKEEFRKTYLTYYQENLYITPREDISKNKLSWKKRKIRTFAIKNNIENEMHYIFKWSGQLFQGIKHLFNAILRITISILLLIPVCIKSIFIILKLIRKLLSTVKQKILKIF